MISYDQSKKILKKAKIKIKDEIILSENSLNRVISNNIYSKINYPAGDNAAFDGFAVNSRDTNRIKKTNERTLNTNMLLISNTYYTLANHDYPNPNYLSRDYSKTGEHWKFLPPPRIVPTP